MGNLRDWNCLDRTAADDQDENGESSDIPKKERMDPHYYHLKKLCRKKGAPIFAYKIDAQEFIKDEENVGLLREALNIESGHELMETSYILINEEKMKLP